MTCVPAGTESSEKRFALLTKMKSARMSGGAALIATTMGFSSSMNLRMDGASVTRLFPGASTSSFRPENAARRRSRAGASSIACA